MLGSGREKGLHGGRSGGVFLLRSVPIDWEKEGIVLDLARWDLHNDEDGFHDGRGGQDL